MAATETQTHSIVIQRPLRGSRISSFYPVKSLPALSLLDSAFQLQEYISLLIRLDVHDVDRIVSLPGGATTTNKDAKEKELSKDGGGGGEQQGRDGGEEGKTDVEGGGDKEKDEKDVTVDEACWIYEQLRRLAQDLSHPLITTLQQECSRTTCPEMKAGEWLYLCVAHGNEGAMEQCCAIDYILHTLDSATALLNSPRAFPSRLQIPASSHRHFSSLARRLGRIFAHAYFHHREAFEQAEAESSLYARFLALTSKFDLVPPEFLVIPTAPDDEDSSEDDEHGSGSRRDPTTTTFGEREVKLGTSYDPRRGLGHHTIMRQQQQRQRQLLQHQQQYQQQSSYQDEFPDIPRVRRPQHEQQQQQQQQHHRPQLQQLQDIQTQVQPGLGSGGGTESPKKVGRNRTDTMVLSEVSGLVDDLAKAAAAAKADEERQRKEKEEEEEEREAQKGVGEKTYAAAVVAAAGEGLKEQEQGGEVGVVEADLGKDEQEPVIEGEVVVGPSAQDNPEIEISAEQLSSPGEEEEAIVEEARGAETLPGETVGDDSTDSTTAVVDVEVSGQTAEDAETSTTTEGEEISSHAKEETPEVVERELNEEGDGEEDDIAEEGIKEADEVEPKPNAQEGVEAEGVEVKPEAIEP